MFGYFQVIEKIDKNQDIRDINFYLSKARRIDLEKLFCDTVLYHQYTAQTMYCFPLSSKFRYVLRHRQKPMAFFHLKL